MKFSLVLTTIRRTDELRRFLDALAAQTYRDFELIVVDQNTNSGLKDLLAPYEQLFSLLHIEQYERGASRGRNLGLNHIQGDIVTFPDDDCWFRPDLLATVAQWFADHPGYHGITGCSVDEAGQHTTARWDLNPGPITPFNVWRRGISSTIFLLRKAVDKVGPFDPDLGVGAGTQWGSGEESDYLLRVLAAGFTIYYEPKITILHLEPVQIFNEKTLKRGVGYAPGIGRVLRKHNYPLWFVAYQFLRPLGGSMVSFLKGERCKAQYHWIVCQGRFQGWIS